MYLRILFVRSIIITYQHSDSDFSVFLNILPTLYSEFVGRHLLTKFFRLINKLIKSLILLDAYLVPLSSNNTTELPSQEDRLPSLENGYPVLDTVTDVSPKENGFIPVDRDVHKENNYLALEDGLKLKINQTPPLPLENGHVFKETHLSPVENGYLLPESRHLPTTTGEILGQTNGYLHLPNYESYQTEELAIKMVEGGSTHLVKPLMECPFKVGSQ